MWNNLTSHILPMIGAFFLHLLSAATIVVVGVWLVKRITGVIDRLLTKRNVDPTIAHFVNSASQVILYGLVFIEAIHKAGVDSSSLIALVGAAGFAVGFAMKSHLSNVAAGLLIILFRPFSVGHYILIGKTEGTVEKVELLHSYIRTPDNIIAIVPNSNLTSSQIINYSLKDTRRVVIAIRIGYDTDFRKVKECVQSIIDEDARILSDRKTIIAIQSLGELNVKVVIRFWVKSSDHWRVQFDVTEKIKERFEIEGIKFSAQEVTKEIPAQ